MTYFMVNEIQAVDPTDLDLAEGIVVDVEEESDSMGFPRVAIYGTTREGILAYYLSQWGDEDPAFTQSYVVGRIEEVQHMPGSTASMGFTLYDLPLIPVRPEGVKGYYPPEVPIENSGCDTLNEVLLIARQHLATRGEGYEPWIAVVGHAPDGDEVTGWSEGWVAADGAFRSGDYDDDVRLYP